MKGALWYYTFLMVFIVTFVAVAGMQRNGVFGGITGYAVDASAVPMTRDADTIQREVAAYLPAPTKPVALRRMFVIPNPDIDPMQLSRLAELRHQFPNGFSADIRETDLVQLKTLAELQPIPIYELPDHPIPAETDGNPLIILGVETAYPNQVQCKDFTHGPEVRSCSTTDSGAVLGETDVFSYVVCDASRMCFADDVAAALSYAAAHQPTSILLPFSAELPIITEAKARALAAGAHMIS